MAAGLFTGSFVKAVYNHFLHINSAFTSASKIWIDCTMDVLLQVHAHTAHIHIIHTMDILW